MARRCIVLGGTVGFVVGALLAFLLMVSVAMGGDPELTFASLLRLASMNLTAWLGALIGGVVVAGAVVTTAWKR